LHDRTADANALAVARNLGRWQAVSGFARAAPAIAPFVSVTRTDQQLSIVGEESCVSDGKTRHGGFRCPGVVDPRDFATVGVIVALAGPLADAEIIRVPLGTYDTDYTLIRQEDLIPSARTLMRSGHRFAKTGID
jgi:hypothetical protein